MEETPASQKMAKIDLINSLEKISSEIPDRILKLEGFILKENQKEKLEIIIFRGYSSSTTHPIEIDSEKKVIALTYIIKNSLSWLEKSGNKEVDLYSDWLIVSKFSIVNSLSKDFLITDNNELGKIQILKAQGQKCDRCWHYQNFTVNGIENTKLCKRCANIITF